MRTLLLLLTVLGADGAVPGAPARPAVDREARRAFARAYDAGALDEARAALQRRREAAPGRIDLGYDLACLEARAGQLDLAFAALEPLARAGLEQDPALDPDLAPLHGDPRWASLLSRFAESRRPVSSGGPESVVPPELELVEDLAEDPRSGALLVSSVRTGEVWRRLDGRWQVWARPAGAGSGAFALALDSKRRLLHLTVAAVPQAGGFRKTDQGRTALVTLRLDDGAELARRTAPEDGPHLLGDLTLMPDGTVLAADALAGTVYRLAPGGAALEPLVPVHTFASPQTPVLSPDGRTLFVPDWTLGLFALPLAGGEPAPVLGPADLVTAGIDGLAPAPGGLIAVQNGIVQSRLVRLWLSPDGRRVTRWAVLARGPDLGDPTHVLATRRGALVLIDSGWGRFTLDGALRPGAPPPRPRLLRLELR